MIRRDYIMRWAKELAKVLARLLGKNPEEGLEIISQSYHSLLDLDPEELLTIPLDRLLDWLRENRQFNEGQLAFLAELLYRQGEYCYELGHFVQCRPYFIRALLIFEYLDEQEETFSFERKGKLAKIEKLIAELGEQASD